MKFALLGADPETLALARAVRGSSAHELTWIGGTAEVGRQLGLSDLEMDRKLRPASSWEGLLGGTVADAVIVGRGDTAEAQADGLMQADQLVRLVQGGIPVLASLPIPAPLLSYFEIDSLRGEPPVAVVPALGWRWHPAMERLRALAGGAGATSPGGEPAQAISLGRIEQLVFERFLADRSRPGVLRQFASDVDLVQSLTGDVTHLGAMAPGDARNEDKPRFDSLGVQSYGPRGVMLRWSVAPIETTAGARISLSGVEGRAVLEAPAGGRPWRLEIRLRDSRTGEPEKTPRVEEFPEWEPSDLLLEHFVREATRRPSMDDDQPELARRPTRAEAATARTGPTWPDATRAAELAEAIDRSIARRRTIEVRVERESEASAFRGTMAAVGCSLLLLSLPMFVLGVILGNKPFGFVFAGKMVIYTSVGLMVVFLLLQGLGMLVPKAGKERPGG